MLKGVKGIFILFISVSRIKRWFRYLSQLNIRFKAESMAPQSHKSLSHNLNLNK
jgi:hypothetical protein